MHILITGASGLVGQHLTRELLTHHPQHSLLLADIVSPPTPLSPTAYPAPYPANLKTVQCDLLTSELSPLFAPVPDVIFVLHGIMSAQSESNHVLGLSVNIDSTRRLLDALPQQGIRIVYASSTAVYGQPLPDLVGEDVIPRPLSSYGCGKMVMEYILNDYTRRGLVDAVILRFPTVVVRPGEPSPAASAFLSGIIREPFNGIKTTLPVSRDLRAWICSPDTLIKNLVVAMEMDTGKLRKHVRQVNMPGITVSVQEILDAIVEVGGKDLLSFVKEERDVEVQRIVGSWPVGFDTKVAQSLGMKGSTGGVVGCVREYKEWLDEQRMVQMNGGGT